MKLVDNLKLDFDIVPQSSPYYMSIIDLSQYNMVPENAELLVLIPGYSSYIKIDFDIEQINVLNSGLLALSSSPTSLTILPDGVYTLTYRICPHDILYVTKKHLRTSEIECKYLNLYSKITSECGLEDKEKVQKLDKIKNYIEAAKANGSICNYLKAAEFIQRANSLLLETGCSCS